MADVRRCGSVKVSRAWYVLRKYNLGSSKAGECRESVHPFFPFLRISNVFSKQLLDLKCYERMITESARRTYYARTIPHSHPAVKMRIERNLVGYILYKVAIAEPLRISIIRNYTLNSN